LGDLPSLSLELDRSDLHRILLLVILLPNWFKQFFDLSDLGLTSLSHPDIFFSPILNSSRDGETRAPFSLCKEMGRIVVVLKWFLLGRIVVVLKWFLLACKMGRNNLRLLLLGRKLGSSNLRILLLVVSTQGFLLNTPLCLKLLKGSRRLGNSTFIRLRLGRKLKVLS
jgi:hypothetical protein